ncbi:MAG: hypothetical protein ACREOO_17295 [bacterium]
MRRKRLLAGLLLTFVCYMASAQTTGNSDRVSLPLTSTEGLELINVKAKVAEHKGRKSLLVTRADQIAVADNRETLAIIPGVEFKNGTIEVELAGEPAADADAQARGFVGIAFRVQKTDPLSYEGFYLRPVNGRAEDQLQRNHSTQYISHPEYPWFRLRKEYPGVYESYVDLVTGEWTKVRMVVSGQQARVYVHGAEQPCLIVKDLKHGETTGKVALWLASSTVAHFRNLVITPDREPSSN